MNRVIVNFLSLCLLLAVTNLNEAKADFAQTQVRYASFYDLYNYFKSLETTDDSCSRPRRSAGEVFGYSSPVSGKPSSEKPNFDFLNSYLKCLKDYSVLSKMKERVFGRDISNERPNYLPPINSNGSKKEQVEKLMDEMILKLIGPEVVLVSYGLVKNQKELRDLLYVSASKMMGENDYNLTDKFLEYVYILIHLRDEFLSY